MLDANILIRAVMGTRVRTLIAAYGEHVKLYSPDVAFSDARSHLPAIMSKRKLSKPTLEVLSEIEASVESVPFESYAIHRRESERRISARDIDDWPVLACALLLDCPIWTEDADFFGAGVATWTTDRVSLYLHASDST